MIKGIILDLDGLISDTERLHMLAFQKTFLEFSVEITKDFYKDHWIRKGLGSNEAVEIFNIDKNPDEIRARKNIFFKELLDSDLKPMPYIYDFVKAFYKKVPLAVASASQRKDVLYILEKLDLLKYMDLVLSCDDVKNRKPDPEVWIKAAAMLNLKTDNCICLEDAEKGVIAAYKANMPVIAIPTIYTDTNDFSKAHYIVKDLNQARQIIENLMD